MEGLGAALQQLGGPWAVLIVAGFYALHVSGVLRWLVTQPVSIRQQLAAEQQRLFENQRQEINDRQSRIVELESRIDARDQQVDSLIRGTSRLRHLTANLAAILQATRALCRRNGLTPPPINVDSLFGVEESDAEDDFAELLRKALMDQQL